ncbi:hypothetical protein H0H87_004406 [Tephrocybe sp. NHM501043]|nr:hypothetical protein H0H87_004406 [Tephrocybe sp. NHM501043]
MIDHAAIHKYNCLEVKSTAGLKTASPARESSPKPWEDWQLNASFLSAVNDWSNKNPRSTLTRILEAASLAIDEGKDLVEIIPDAPFPAKSLIKALLQLVKLGANISLAHLKLLEFAKDIVAWVDGIASSFARAGDGSLLAYYFSSVKSSTRYVPGQLYGWHADRRWSISNLKVNNEIADFKGRLKDARQLFQDCSIIGMSGGFDSTMRKLGAVLGYQDKITRILGKIRRTQDDHYRRLMDELQGQKETQARRQFLQTFLNPYTAERLTYNQQEKMPCDEGTRVEVLTEIRQWVNDVSSSSRNFLWLTGDPGCGKSAVTASVARECKDRKVLWAQFFINRNIKDTTNPNLYFPSIARQLADYSELVERQVHFALVEHPSIIDEISPMQATKLFVDTLAAAASIDTKTPVVVVIDGLDETQREHLESTATIFSHLFDALAKYRNAKVFISSRTEDGIQKPFSKSMKDKRVKNLHLYTNAESSIRDVNTYLRRRIAHTALQHRLDPMLWPGEERLAALAFHAAGHFIWAVTVTRFLQEQMEEWGHECIDTVMLNLGTTEGKQDIKVLYGLILQLTYQKSKDSWAFETFRRIVGAVATALEPLSIGHLESLLDLRRDPTSALVDLHHFVRRLRTVLVAGTDDITTETMLRLHKSFFEYITSDSCEDRFRVSLEASNAELAVQCLQQMAKAYSDIRGAMYYSDPFKTFSLPFPLQYALKFCASHFPVGNPIGFVVDNQAITPLQLDAMIHFSSNTTDAAPLCLHYPHNAKHFSSSIDEHLLFWNATTGRITSPRPRLTTSMPNSKSGVPGRVECLAILPDGTKIASASSFKDAGRCTLHIWDAMTLQIIGTHELESDPRSIVFSQDGEQVAMTDCVRVGAICVINLQTGLCVKENYDNTRVEMLMFSRNGTLHVFGSENHPTSRNDKDIFRWILGGFSKRVKLDYPNDWRRVYSIVPSLDYKEIISVTDKHIFVWDFETSALLRKLSNQGVHSAMMSRDNGTVVLDGISSLHIGDVESSDKQKWKKWEHRTDGRGIRLSPKRDHLLSWSQGDVRLQGFPFGDDTLLDLPFPTVYPDPEFSSDGEHIFVPTVSQIEKIAIPQCYLNKQPLKSKWTSFSPDGKFHVFADSEGGLLFRNSSSENTTRLPFKTNTSPVIQYAKFSLSASRLVGISIVGTVYLWDTSTRDLVAISAQAIHGITAVSFSSDEEEIIVERPEKPYIRLVPGDDGCLVALPTEKNGYSLLPAGFAPNINAGTCIYVSTEDAPNRRLDRVRWFSSHSPHDRGFWAFINNYMIRGTGDGSFVVVPVDKK